MKYIINNIWKHDEQECKKMKILNSFGPNPRMLRMFLAEKDLKMDMAEHDLLAGENRESAYI